MPDVSGDCIYQSSRVKQTTCVSAIEMELQIKRWGKEVINHTNHQAKDNSTINVHIEFECCKSFTAWMHHKYHEL